MNRDQINITLKKDEKFFVLKYYSKMKHKELAENLGLSVHKIRHNLKIMGIRSPHLGGVRIPFDEKKVNIKGCVKRKHYKEVQEKIKELIKPYR